MSEASGTEAAREWLGGEHGGEKLNETLIEILLAGFSKEDDPVWTMDDVPAEDSSINVGNVKKLWLSLLLSMLTPARARTLFVALAFKFDQASLCLL